MSNIYMKKDQSDIDDLLDDTSSLTLEGKLALKEAIYKHFGNENFEARKINKLNDSIEKEFEDIKSLKKLHLLGIDVFTSNGYTTIRKSKTGNKRDMLGVLLGGFSLLFMLIAMIFWIDIIRNGLESTGLVPPVITTLLGISGIIVLLKTADRIFFFKGFKIIRTDKEIILNFRPDSKLETNSFSSNSRFELHQNGSYVLLKIQDFDRETDVIEFKSLGFEATESLKALVSKLNNPIYMN